jgi:ubiquitin-protein ligase
MFHVDVTQNGTFVVHFEFPPQYPFKAPNISFVTRIYHPNVRKETGEICNDLINEGWSPTLNVKHCINVLYNMMQHPDADHPLEVDIATQLVEKPKDFEKTAIKWTKEYACRS